ncbi:hypothetical protein Syun_028716 [Stephania yunnanensis]|uniref:Uncharacterized protein n=1 Tax=Stephania yunnanensis TaxID=152371 RepID=A0AAP0HIS9_9MAGN
MGNHTSHHPFNPATNAGKVILPDGEIHEFVEPPIVAELMLDHPQQVVVEFESIRRGTRPVPLPADKKLEKKKVYVMLPMKQGRVAPLSAEEARRLLLMVKPIWKSSSRTALTLPTLRILPLFAQMCTHVGNIVEGSHDDQIVLNRNVDCDNKDEVISDGFSERSEAFSRQFSGRGWKPSLDTIKEKNVHKKISHWLF